MLRSRITTSGCSSVVFSIVSGKLDASPTTLMSFRWHRNNRSALRIKSVSSARKTLTDIVPPSVRRTRRAKLDASIRLLLSAGISQEVCDLLPGQGRHSSAPVYQFVPLINRIVPTVLAWERLSAFGELRFLRNEEVSESALNFGMKKCRLAFWTSQNPAGHDRSLSVR